MTVNDDERDLAAALVVAMDVGLLSAGDAIRVIDREAAARTSPSPWLIDSALAKTPEDLLHILRANAAGHPMLEEVWPLFEAMERALATGADPTQVACRIKKIYPYGQWPPALDQALYDVYEEATCAHEHGGVPQAASVSQALRALFDAAKRNRAWDSSLERVLLGRDAAEQ
jgi:hypothetical protein